MTTATIVLAVGLIVGVLGHGVRHRARLWRDFRVVNRWLFGAAGDKALSREQIERVRRDVWRQVRGGGR